jgi:hypothetical protein
LSAQHLRDGRERLEEARREREQEQAQQQQPEPPSD